MPAGHRSCSLQGAVACGSRDPGPASGRAARVACPQWLPQGLPHVHAGGRRAEGGRISVRTADRGRHRHGHRYQPGHMYRTPAVRTAVVPEAADGQSADGSGSLRLPLLSSRPPCGRPPAAAVLGRQHHRHRPTALPTAPFRRCELGAARLCSRLGSGGSAPALLSGPATGSWLAVLWLSMACRGAGMLG
jgi:hypothetical protein